MIVIRGRFARYGEIWFDEQVPPDIEVDVLFYRLRRNAGGCGACIPFNSLTTDLTRSSDELMAALGATNRYKIKRAATKDGLACEFLPSPLGRIDDFCAFYDEFARQKGLPSAYRRELDAAAKAGCLVLSAASHAGTRLVWHAYIRGGRTAALLHSASHYRRNDAVDPALVGRANRWLHWCDLLAFKDADVAIYDWGGLFDDETTPANASVNRFKREFGGTPIVSYNCIDPRTLKGRAYVALQRLRERWE